MRFRFFKKQKSAKLEGINLIGNVTKTPFKLSFSIENLNKLKSKLTFKNILNRLNTTIFRIKVLVRFILKKYFYFLSFSVLILGLLMNGFLITKYMLEPKQAPARVRITNKTDQGFTVSWVTYGKKTKGSVFVYEDGKPWVPFFSTFFSKEYKDERDILSEEWYDENTRERYVTHFVEIKDLKEDTKYNIRLASGNKLFTNNDEGEDISWTKTFETIEGQVEPKPAYGNIKTDYGRFLSGSIVYIKLKNEVGEESTLISALTNKDGKYIYEPSTARTKDGKSFFKGLSVEELIMSESGDEGRGLHVTNETRNKPVQPQVIASNQKTLFNYEISLAQELEQKEEELYKDISTAFKVNAKNSDETENFKSFQEIDQELFEIGLLLIFLGVLFCPLTYKKLLNRKNTFLLWLVIITQLSGITNFTIAILPIIKTYAAEKEQVLKLPAELNQTLIPETKAEVCCGGGTCGDGWSFGEGCSAHASCDDRKREACSGHEGGGNDDPPPNNPAPETSGGGGGNTCSGDGVSGACAGKGYGTSITISAASGSYCICEPSGNLNAAGVSHCGCVAPIPPPPTATPIPEEENDPPSNPITEDDDEEDYIEPDPATGCEAFTIRNICLAEGCGWSNGSCNEKNGSTKTKTKSPTPIKEPDQCNNTPISRCNIVPNCGIKNGKCIYKPSDTPNYTSTPIPTKTKETVVCSGLPEMFCKLKPGCGWKNGKCISGNPPTDTSSNNKVCCSSVYGSNDLKWQTGSTCSAFPHVNKTSNDKCANISNSSTTEPREIIDTTQKVVCCSSSISGNPFTNATTRYNINGECNSGENKIQSSACPGDPAIESDKDEGIICCLSTSGSKRWYEGTSCPGTHPINAGDSTCKNEDTPAELTEEASKPPPEMVCCQDYHSDTNVAFMEKCSTPYIIPTKLTKCYNYADIGTFPTDPSDICVGGDVARNISEKREIEESTNIACTKTGDVWCCRRDIQLNSCLTGIEDMYSKSTARELESQDPPYSCRESRGNWCCTSPEKMNKDPREEWAYCDGREEEEGYETCLNFWGVDDTNSYKRYKDTPCDLCEELNTVTCNKYCSHDSIDEYLDSLGQEDLMECLDFIPNTLGINTSKPDVLGTSKQECPEALEAINSLYGDPEDPYGLREKYDMLLYTENYDEPGLNLPEGETIEDLVERGIIPGECILDDNDPQAAIQKALYGAKYSLDLTCMSENFNEISHQVTTNNNEIYDDFDCNVDYMAEQQHESGITWECADRIMMVPLTLAQYHGMLLEKLEYNNVTLEFCLQDDNFTKNASCIISLGDSHTQYRNENGRDLLSVGLGIATIVGTAVASPILVLMATGGGIALTASELAERQGTLEAGEAVLITPRSLDTVEDARELLSGISEDEKSIYLEELVRNGIINSSRGVSNEDFYEAMARLSRCIKNPESSDVCYNIPQTTYDQYEAVNSAVARRNVNAVMLGLEVAGGVGDVTTVSIRAFKNGLYRTAAEVAPNVMANATTIRAGVPNTVLRTFSNSIGVPPGAGEIHFLYSLYDSLLSVPGTSPKQAIQQITENLPTLYLWYSRVGRLQKVTTVARQAPRAVVNTQLQSFILDHWEKGNLADLQSAYFPDQQFEACVDSANASTCAQEIEVFITTLSPDAAVSVVSTIAADEGLTEEQLRDLFQKIEQNALIQQVTAEETSLANLESVEYGYTLSSPFPGGYIKWDKSKSMVYPRGTLMDGTEVLATADGLFTPDGIQITDAHLIPTIKGIHTEEYNDEKFVELSKDIFSEEYENYIKRKMARGSVSDTKFKSSIEIPQVVKTDLFDFLVTGKMGRVGVQIDDPNKIYKVTLINLQELNVSNKIQFVKTNQGINTVDIGINTKDKVDSSGLIDKVSAQEKTNRVDDGFYKQTPNNESILSVQLFEDKNSSGQKDSGEEYLDLPGVLLKLEEMDNYSTYKMPVGWNLISVPFNPGYEYSANDLLKDILKQGGYATTVSKYEGGRWISYKVRGSQVFSDDDFEIEPGRGYFVKVIEPAEIIIAGISEEDSIEVELEYGWNLIAIHPGRTKEGEYIWNHKIDGGQWTAEKVLMAMQKDEIDADVISKYESGTYTNLVLSDGVVYGFDYPIFQTTGYFVRVQETKTNSWKP